MMFEWRISIYTYVFMVASYLFASIFILPGDYSCISADGIFTTTGLWHWVLLVGENVFGTNGIDCNKIIESTFCVMATTLLNIFLAVIYYFFNKNSIGVEFAAKMMENSYIGMSKEQQYRYVRRPITSVILMAACLASGVLYVSMYGYVHNHISDLSPKAYAFLVSQYTAVPYLMFWSSSINWLFECILCMELGWRHVYRPK